MLQAGIGLTRCAPSAGLFRCATRRYSGLPSTRIAALLHPSKTDAHAEDTLAVHGFVRSIRRQKRVAFAAIGDGSTLKPLQAVLAPEQAAGLSTGTAVRLTGKWVRSPSDKEQTHELQVEDVLVLGENDATSYPIQKKYHTSEYLRTIPHLRSRIPSNAILLRLRSDVIASVSNFFSRHGFVQTHPPIITSSDCEGAGEVFQLAINGADTVTSADQSPCRPNTESFFRTTKYLTVSSQLHLEALAQSIGSVWALSPTFRAERSDTPRHLSEFYMLEAEICFVEDQSVVMDVVENVIREVAQNLRATDTGNEILAACGSRNEPKIDGALSREGLEHRWKALAETPWPRITYKDAVEVLQQAVSHGTVSFDFEPIVGSGLQAEHERYLVEAVGGGSPVFVTDYPRHIKAFYMSTSSDPTSTMPTAACFDLLVPELCEVAGGSMREHRLPALLDNMARHGLLKPPAAHRGPEQSTESQSYSARQDSLASSGVPANLQWYVDLRRYGSVPHGGFGIGFDRLLCYLSGVSSVRDIVAFPRWYGRCDC